MSVVKKVLLGIAAVVVALAALFLLLVGPWPVYGDKDVSDAAYYEATVSRIDEATAEVGVPGVEDALQAGWAVSDMTPELGVPLAGYGDRPAEKGAQGVRDPLKARALALGSGGNTVVILGTDMLIIPPDLATRVIDLVHRQTGLTARNIYFTATHTHCGPGGIVEGVAGRMFGGAHDPSVPEALANAFAEAIVDAYHNMAPARLAHGYVDAEEFIRNRVRSDAPVDSALNYMIVEQEDGARCYLVRFSAHPTVFGSDMMEFSAEFPGEMMRHIEEHTGATAVYVGGAVGSMSARAPSGESRDERVRALGEALGELVLEAVDEPTFVEQAKVASLSTPLDTPPFQLRPVSPNWRLSPFASRWLGVKDEAWLQAARIGDMLFYGLPFDVSGELAKRWREEAAREGWDLWITSFSPGYLGYLSPDKYYEEVEEEGRLGYEMGLMNWLGPNSAEYFEALLFHVKERLGPAPIAVRTLIGYAPPLWPEELAAAR